MLPGLPGGTKDMATSQLEPLQPVPRRPDQCGTGEPARCPASGAGTFAAPRITFIVSVRTPRTHVAQVPITRKTCSRSEGRKGQPRGAEVLAASMALARSRWSWRQARRVHAVGVRSVIHSEYMRMVPGPRDRLLCAAAGPRRDPDSEWICRWKLTGVGRTPCPSGPNTLRRPTR